MPRNPRAHIRVAPGRMDQSAAGRRRLAGPTARRSADRPQRASRWNAVSDREHSVAEVRGKAAAWIATLVEDAKMPDQTVEILLKPVAAIITSGATDVPSARSTRSDSTASRADDLDAPGPHDVDELVGQRRDATSLFDRRLQPEWRAVEAVGRQVSPHEAVEAPDQRIDLARGNPGRTVPGRCRTEWAPWPVAQDAAVCGPQAISGPRRR